MSQADALARDYDMLMDLIRTRTSVRKLKSDPIPDDYVTKVLEAGRWAMSGANGQPWDFIVVKDAAIKKQLFRAYSEVNQEFIYWMEQQRDFKLRHPAYQMTHQDSVQRQRTQVGWSEAPVLIVITGDGRRQWATVQGAHTFGRDQSHLTDGLSNASMLMHLAAAALGLGSQHVTIHIEEPFKRILGVPDLLRLVLIMPLGFPAVPPKAGVRRPLADMVHKDRFDMSKYMSNEQVIEFLYELRSDTIPVYKHSLAGDAGPSGPKT
ncbi:MAG TPA: nitroreductase family protein [Xanthobacteraceae bacterium]|nr:nitroreductase family protein [Xanthobacteraceae bacterium]